MTNIENMTNNKKNKNVIKNENPCIENIVENACVEDITDDVLKEDEKKNEKYIKVKKAKKRSELLKKLHSKIRKKRPTKATKNKRDDLLRENISAMVNKGIDLRKYLETNIISKMQKKKIKKIAKEMGL
jgi:signal recognition particle subunit SEC65